MKDLAVVVLAAGKGTRMRSETPKLLFDLAGRPVGCWVIEAALALRPARVVVVVGHGREALRAALETRFPGAPLGFALQKEQLGTGHALRCALPRLPADARRILVLSGDTPLLRPDLLRPLVSLGRTHPMALLTCRTPEPAMYGRILRGEDGSVRRIVEARDAGEAERRIDEINPAVYLLDAGFLRRGVRRLGRRNAQREFYLTDLVAMAAEEPGGVADLPAAFDDLRGINHRGELAEAEARLLARIRGRWMEAGVTLRRPETIRIEADVRLAPDVEVGAGAELLGHTVVAGGARIGPGCVLRDTVVGPGATLLPYVVATESVVEAGARIGPFAHLRPRSRIGEGAHVGNFVETKNTLLMAGAKANHLAYLGDGTVGRRSNVGAGTIFCNYDGFQKHRTTLGDDVFIGSDSQLVAPVTVGDRAYVASGSTVTRDVPADALAVARARQETKPGYARRLRSRLSGRSP